MMPAAKPLWVEVLEAVLLIWIANALLLTAIVAAVRAASAL